MDRRLGPVSLERLLLEDEAGAWYEAHISGDDETCAALVLARGDSLAPFRERLESTRNTRARGWLRLREFVEAAGEIVAVFDPLPGRPLRERKGQESWETVCAWMAQICDALHSLHMAGLLRGGLDLDHVWVEGERAVLVGLAATSPAFDALERRIELGAVATTLIDALRTGPAPEGMLDDATVVSAGVQLQNEGIEAPDGLQTLLDQLLGAGQSAAALATAADVAAALRALLPGEAATPSKVLAADSLVGTTLAGYEILGVLGKGGMGVVYEAWDPRLDRRLALKRIRSEALGETGKQRFLVEARACSRINHPHVVTVYASGEENGDPYLAMELLRGRTLKDLRRAEPVRWEDAVRWCADILDALAPLHAENIVHRDLKLDNIMLGEDGRVRLMDFGLATVTSEATLTAAGSTVGTAWYMSPEQAGGKPVDARSDVFSMGVVLYELLTGDRPFTGDHPLAVLLAIQQKDFEAVTAKDPSLPTTLDPILARAMRKDPEERYASAEEFRDALLAVLQPANVAAPPPAKRWPLVAAGVLALVVAGFLVPRWMDSNDTQAAVQHNELGADYESQERWADARTEYRKAILADPDYAIPYNNLGQLAWREGEFAEADSLYWMALERDPGFAAAHFNLATSRWDQGDREGAEAAYRAAIAARPEFPGAYGNLGALLLEMDRVEAAREVLDAGLGHAADDAQLLRHRGRAAWSEGEREAAIADWEHALRSEPEEFRVHALLAEALEAMGIPERALTHYEALLRSPLDEHREAARQALARLAP